MISLDSLKNSQTFEQACCAFYENKIVQTLLGSSFHPGGLSLTKELGLELHFSPSDTILDLATGLGTSAIFLAEKFGSSVVGIDISKNNLVKAQQQAKLKKVDDRVTFRIGSVNNLEFEDNSFDFIIIECSFCLFQNKPEVGKEIFRILKPNGKVLVTDIAIEKELPIDINHIIYEVACIANAVSMEENTSYFQKSGFTVESVTGRSEILLNMTEEIKKKIFLLEMASGLKKINLQKEQIKEIKQWIQKAKDLIKEGYVSYMVLIATK